MGDAAGQLAHGLQLLGLAKRLLRLLELGRAGDDAGLQGLVQPLPGLLGVGPLDASQVRATTASAGATSWSLQLRGSGS